MSKYRFAGETELFYPTIIIPGEGSLTARPGDVRDFEDGPPPGNWVPVEDAKPDTKPASPPVSPAPADPVPPPAEPDVPPLPSILVKAAN